MLADQRELSVTDRPLAGSLTRQKFNDNLSLLAQRGDVRSEFAIMVAVRRQDGPRWLSSRCQARHFTQIHRETGCRTRPSEDLAGTIVAAAERNRHRIVRAVGGKHHAIVVMVTAQVCEIERKRQVGRQSHKMAQVGERC